MISPSFCCRRSQTNNQHKPKGTKRPTLLLIMPATGSIHPVGKYLPVLFSPCFSPSLSLSPEIGSPLHSPNGENFFVVAYFPRTRPRDAPRRDHHMFVSPGQIMIMDMIYSGPKSPNQSKLKIKMLCSHRSRRMYSYTVRPRLHVSYPSIDWRVM